MTERDEKPHWSEVLGDVADLGARADEARRESLAAAAEGAAQGTFADTPAVVIGAPPPRDPRSRPRASEVARARSGTAVDGGDEGDGDDTVRIATRAPAPAASGPRIGPPPPRQPRGGAAAATGPTADTTGDDDAPARTGRRLLKDNLVVAAGTALSRATGVGRLLAVYLLSRSLADAYLVANNTPNIIYELILGGILTATLVPLFTKHLEEDDEEATSAVVSTVVVTLFLLTLVALLVAPLLILLYRSNIDSDVDASQFLRVGIYLSLLFAPQVFFYGLVAMGSAILNSRHRFFAASWVPIVNNLVVISVLVVAARLGGRGQLTLPEVDDNHAVLLLLGLGTTTGIAAMALALLPALHRSGVRIKFRPSWRHPAVRATARLSGWTLGYVIANQVAAQTVLVLAFNDSGTVRSYQTGFIFFQLPHGLLAVSLMTTFEPDLAKEAVRERWPAFHARLLQGLRLLLTVMVPAAVGYFTIAMLVIRHGADATLFQDSTRLDVARALAGFAPGLLGFSVYLFVLRGFYAVRDTRRPFWINAVENVINIVLAVILTIALPLLVGLTVSYSLAYIAAAAIALAVLLRRLPPGFDIGGFVSTLIRALLAAGAMAVAVVAVIEVVVGADPQLLAVGIVASVPVGLLVYAVAALGFGVVRDAGLAGRLPGPLGRLGRP